MHFVYVNPCQVIGIYTRAATNIRLVQILVRILVFRFSSFAFGIHLHGIMLCYV